MVEAALPAQYPVRLEVDYPEWQSRWKALFRIFLALPVLIFAAILGGTDAGGGATDDRGFAVVAGAAGAVVLAIWITIILRQNIPRWLFNFLVALHRFEFRALGYLALLTDEYPPFEGDHTIRYEVDYPDRVSRWRVIIWKAITSIPHFFIVLVLFLTVIVVVIIAWFAILISGRYPRGLHTYVSGSVRWGARVQAYFLSLTDEFPPFSLAADAGPGGRDSYVLSSVIGVGLTAVAIGGGIALAVVAVTGEDTVAVSYQELLAGQSTVDETKVVQDPVVVSLTSGTDPADDVINFLDAKEDYRLVSYRLVVDIKEDRNLKFRERDFRLKDSKGKKHEPLLVVVDGRIPPETVKDGTSVNVDLVFEVPDDRGVAELRYGPARPFADTVVYEFE